MSEKLSIVQFNDVSYAYPTASSPALSGIGLDFGEGEFVGLIGPTGSGKSTLVQLMNGLLAPDSGEILYRGRRVGREIHGVELRREVGVVFQFPESQLFEPSVSEDVAFGPRNQGFSGEELERKVKSALEAVGLSHDLFARRSPFSLSGGEMRRVAIAGVLAMEPSLLVLDEPTSGLDARGRRELLDRLTELNAGGLTVLLVTHDMDEAALADRLIVLDDGRVAMEGSPSSVFSRREEVLAIGLDLPSAAVIMSCFRERGFDVPLVLSLTDAREAIITAMGRSRT